MIMTPGLRKFTLTAHVTSSVGWLGSVAVFLALAITGLTSQNAQMVSAAYLAMELSASFVLVPLCLVSLLTGLIMALGTKWGLFRHYWILVKLMITVLSTLLFLVHLQPIRHMARAAAEATVLNGDVRGLQVQLAANAGAALLWLLVATTLSVFKPSGVTMFGRRRRPEQEVKIS